MSRRATIALSAAGACVLALAWVYVAAFHVGVTVRADERILAGFQSLATPGARSLASFVAGFFDLLPYAIAVLLVLSVAQWRGGVRWLLAAAVILAGANVSTELLKLLTAAPRQPPTIDAVSWPSGHVTAAASLALCVVLVAPVALRPAAAGLGGLAVVATAYAVLVNGTHHPSDALGGLLMAGAWAATAVAALELAEQRRPSARLPEPAAARRRLPWLGAGAAAVALGVLLELVSDVATPGAYLSDKTTFVAGAIVLAVCGAALPVAAATLLDRAAP